MGRKNPTNLNWWAGFLPSTSHRKFRQWLATFWVAEFWILYSLRSGSTLRLFRPTGKKGLNFRDAAFFCCFSSWWLVHQPAIWKICSPTMDHFPPKGSGWKRHIWNHHPSSCSGGKVETINLQQLESSMNPSLKNRCFFFTFHWSEIGTKKSPNLLRFFQDAFQTFQIPQEMQLEDRENSATKTRQIFFPFHQTSTLAQVQWGVNTENHGEPKERIGIFQLKCV